MPYFVTKSNNLITQINFKIIILNVLNSYIQILKELCLKDLVLKIVFDIMMDNQLGYFMLPRHSYQLEVFRNPARNSDPIFKFHVIERGSFWFQLDKALAHISPDDYLELATIFEDRWIGPSGPWL